MKIIIPMAGLGSRFSVEGYKDPKPFIDVDGKPMIRAVVDHIGLHRHEHIFICNSEHLKNYNMYEIFADMKIHIVELDTVTEGAAISVSKANNLIDIDEDFIVVNSDQLIHYDNSEVERVRESDIAGCIWCFTGSGNNWSYARLDDTGKVVEIAEKRQISNTATSGMYYWRSWHEYIAALSKMMLADDRVNNEFYVAPVYNYTHGRTEIRMVDHVDQLGTPEELKIYEHKIRIHRDN